VAHRHIVGMQIVLTNRTHHDFSRVDTNAQLQGDTAFEPGLVGMLTHLLLHPERRIQRTLRMVFVRDRRTEQGKDPVAQRLGYIAVIAMHRIHHQL